MRPFVLLLSLACLNCSAWAAPSSVWWPSWGVASSEELSQGIKYSRGEEGNETPSYPLPLLFDGNPATAWVYSATSKEWDTTIFNSRYGVLLTPEHAIMLDSLRLMNGQNQDGARFLRNDRVLQIRVTMEVGKTKVVRFFNIADRMGWQNIALPRRKIKSLKIEFTKIQHGVGPGNDLCLSELALFDGGRKINMAMPRAVMFSDGTEGCSANYLILRDGRMLDGMGTDAGDEDQWSANGRYVCGFNGGGGSDKDGYLWVGDVQRGKIVRKIRRPDLAYEWDGNALHITGWGRSNNLKQTIKMP